MAAATTAMRVKMDAGGRKTEVSTSKQKTVTVASKPEAKGKAVVTTTKKTTTKTATIRPKSEKKVYTLPGQKYDPPEEREPLRIFYESLSKQIPTSEMAEFWMMEHGLLSHEKSKKAYERKQRKQHQLRMGTPTKSPVKSQKFDRPESSKSQLSKNMDLKAKKRVYSSDSGDDFIIKSKKSKF